MAVDETLDDAVFQRMEADHCQPPTHFQAGQCTLQAGLQVGQLAVDVDANGLEAARGRVDVVLAAPYHRTQQVSQVGGTRERLVATARHDGLGDTPAQALFAIGPQHVGDLCLIGARQPLRRAFATVRVHAHVQRAVLAEAETTLGHIQLRRRHAQVQQHAIQASRGCIPMRQLREAAAMDRHARIARERMFGMGNRFGVFVHQQQPTSRAEFLQHAARMTTASKRAIQIGSVHLYLQPFHDLRKHDGKVAGLRFAAHPGTGRHSFSSSICALRSSSDRVWLICA